MKTKRERFLLYCLLLFSLFPAQSQTIFRNSGKMHIGNGTSETALLYVSGSQLLTDSSAIKLTGTARLDGDLLVNNLTSQAHGFDPTASGGKLLMKGTKRQHITTAGLPYDRTQNYLDKIPTLEIDNRYGVHLSDSLGLSVDTLSLRKGKFILASAYIDGNKTRLAHLLVNDSVKYTRTATDTAVVEIAIALGSSSAQPRDGKVLGFSSPFKRMYADYFTFNYLMAPDPSGLAGSSKSTITYPGFPLEAGRGYLIGQNVYNFSSYSEHWMMPAWNLTSESYNHRMRDTLLLNRYSLQGIRIVDSPVGAIPMEDAYTSESLNTGDVTVALQPGYNYLGNPYTCPLDLLALKQNCSTADDWGVTRDSELESVDLYSGFWILRNGQVQGTPDKENKKFTVSVSYDISQLVGSTVSTDSISPLQIFVVYAYTACTLTIPASKRVHHQSNFLKSGNIISDELLLEVRDLQTEGFDRMCVVFRNHASLNATDAYDAFKMFNTSGGVSQIYTLSADNEKLITSVIPSAQESLAVALVPSSTEQEVELSASRLETLLSPEAVQLEDLKTGDIVDLTKEHYRFTTTPDDNPNRFLLHFKDVLNVVTGIEAYAVETSYRTSLPLPSIAYAANEITISGLQKTDAGAIITITDAQGRILLKETLPPVVGATGKIAYRLPLSSGIYIASLSGSRSITLKFAGR